MHVISIFRLDVLGKVCAANQNRLNLYHPAAYINGHWLWYCSYIFHSLSLISSHQITIYWGALLTLRGLNTTVQEDILILFF